MFCLRNVSPTLDHLFTHSLDEERAFITSISHQIYGIIRRNEISKVDDQFYIKIHVSHILDSGNKIAYGIKINPAILKLAQKGLSSTEVRQEFVHLIQCCLLTHACFTNHITHARLILKGQEVDLRRCLGVEKDYHQWRSLLHGTCELGHVEIVQMLLHAKININISRDGSEMPPLGSACFSSNPHKVEIVDLLLEAEADPNLIWGEGLNILNCLVYSVVKQKKDPTFVSLIEKLLAAGAETNQHRFMPFAKTGVTLLDCTCVPGMPEPSLIQQLIWSGAKGSYEKAEFSGFGELFRESSSQRMAALESYRSEVELLKKLKPDKVSLEDISDNPSFEGPLLILAKSVIYIRAKEDLKRALISHPKLSFIPTVLFGLVISFLTLTPKELNRKLQVEVLSKCKEKAMVL